jgi:DNA polymerase-4/protein ImuB
MTTTVGSQKLVLDYSPECKGLQREMPLQQALSLYGEAELIQADIPYYWDVFNEMLDLLEEKSPLVEGSGLEAIYIGLDGLELIYGNDGALAKAVRSVIPDDFDPHLGIAEGKFPAYLAAQQCSSDNYQILSGDISAFLKDLSCDLLPVSPKIKEKLHSFGLHKLGQVAALAPGPLQAQFGPDGMRMWELSNGHDETPLYPRLTEELIEESITLSTPTATLDVVLMAIEAMLSRSFTKLEQKRMGMRRINLWTRTWMGEHWERNINFKEPAMNTKTAISRIKQIMDVYPQLGPVEQLGIKITGLGCQNGRQKSIFTEVRAKEHLLNDVKQLEFRLGGPQLYRVKAVEPWSRIPERHYAMVPLSQQN